MKLDTQGGNNGINTAAHQETQTKKLVLFDFDGTITTTDTLIEFVRFYKGPGGYLLGMLMFAPILALYMARLLPNWKAKEYFLSRYFKGEKIADFNARCLEFSTRVLPKLIRPEALQAIASYRRQNATLAVVSASAENWVRPWCEQNGMICLATKLQVKDGIITGKFSGKNCYGDEKVCRIQDHFNLTQYNEITAYGDSAGDREMLQLAHHQFYKPFRTVRR